MFGVKMKYSETALSFDEMKDVISSKENGEFLYKKGVTIYRICDDTYESLKASKLIFCRTFGAELEQAIKACDESAAFLVKTGFTFTQIKTEADWEKFKD